MGSEAIIIPIVIDPKAGVAGLKAVGEQAQKTNTQMGGLTTGAGKFGDTMKGAARNALAMFGAMNLMQGAAKILVESFMDAVSGTNRMASAQKILAKSQDEAVASTRKEVVELQTLFAVAKNTELSYTKRQSAIEQLNKKYPDLHRNLTLEKIGTQEVADAIENVIKNMVKRVQLENIIGKVAELTNQADEAVRMADKLGNGPIRNSFLKFAEEARERVDELTTSAIKLQGETIDGSKFGMAFGKAVKKAGEEDIELNPKKLKIKPKEKLDVSGFDFDLALLAKNFKVDKQKFSVFIEGDTTSTEALDDGFDAMMQGYEDAEEAARRLMDMNMQIAGQVSDFMAPAFNSMFEAILNKQDALKAFFNSIGESIKQLISQLISAAIRAAALSLLTGGAAGGGLSFAGAFKKMFGFAAGGLVTGPVSAVVGEGHGTSRSNPEVISPLDRLQQFFSGMMQGNMGYRSGSNMGMASAVLNVPREVILRGSGRELVGVMVLEQGSQRRTG